MGVGKTSVCQALKRQLPGAVFLDGDWCWDADPFVVSPETCAMVIDNITHTLNNFLRCSAYENVIFCWVMHRESIARQILTALDTEDCEVRRVSLVCSEAALRRRLSQDVRRGLRQADVIDRSVARLALYDDVDAVRLDVTHLSPEAAAARIAAMERPLLL